jgi:hypothetical protein
VVGEYAGIVAGVNGFYPTFDEMADLLFVSHGGPVFR